MNDKILDKTTTFIEELRSKSPLVHCITNTVTINDCANAVLAIGASPIMTNAPEEAEEIVNIENALLLNSGTITKEQSENMINSARQATKLNKPIVLDPVGIGISDIRNQTPLEIIKNYKPSIIRGNMSEIKTIANLIGILDECTTAKGVDVSDMDIITKDNIEQNSQIVKNIAEKLDVTIALSGPIDVISNGNETYSIENGHSLMSRITGSGCMLGCILASYNAIARPVEAALTGTLVMDIAGEIAANKVINNNEGTGTFRTYLIDELHKMNKETLIEHANITKL